MSSWGRKEYKDWPSRNAVWTRGALFVSVLLFLGGMALQYVRSWTFAEQEYLGNYVLSSTVGWLRDQGHYRFVTWVDRQSVPHIASGDEIKRVRMPDGKPGYN